MKFLNRVIRFEWMLVAAVATALFALIKGSWALFALLVLAPDLSMLGYLAGPRVGAAAYNLFHILLWPALLALAGLSAGNMLAVEIGLIWLVHISADRALGYGLKLPSGFQDTHLGRIGRKST
jgi:hypothetical protein